MDVKKITNRKVVERTLFTKFNKYMWLANSYMLFLFGTLLHWYLPNKFDKNLIKKLMKGDVYAVSKARDIVQKSKTLKILFAELLFLRDAVINTYVGGLLEKILIPRFTPRLCKIARKIQQKRMNDTLKCFLSVITSSLPGSIISGFTPAFLTEEPSKFMANKLGFLGTYLTLFNAAEFTAYGFNSVMYLFKQPKFSNDFDSLLKESISILIYKIFNVKIPDKYLESIADSYKKFNLDHAKQFVKMHKKKQSRESHLNHVLIRILGVIFHIIAGMLHKKDKSLIACILHFSYNAILSKLFSCLNYEKEIKLLMNDIVDIQLNL